MIFSSNVTSGKVIHSILHVPLLCSLTPYVHLCQVGLYLLVPYWISNSMRKRLCLIDFCTPRNQPSTWKRVFTQNISIKWISTWINDRNWKVIAYLWYTIWIQNRFVKLTQISQYHNIIDLMSRVYQILMKFRVKTMDCLSNSGSNCHISIYPVELRFE